MQKISQRNVLDLLEFEKFEAYFKWNLRKAKKSNMLADTVFEYVENKYPAHMTKVFRRTENIRRNTGKSFSYLNRNFC